MNKLLAIACVIVAGGCAYGAFPTNQCVSTVDVAKVTGNFDSFRWDWNGYEDQYLSVILNENGTGMNLTGYKVAFKVAKKVSGTNQTVYISQSNITPATTNSVITSVAYTNIPADGRYMAEFLLYDTATPVNARILAQGYVDCHNSLYANNDSTFPWPTNSSSLLNYLLLSDWNTWISTNDKASTSYVQAQDALQTIELVNGRGNLTYNSLNSTGVSARVSITNGYASGSVVKSYLRMGLYGNFKFPSLEAWLDDGNTASFMWYNSGVWQFDKNVQATRYIEGSDYLSDKYAAKAMFTGQDTTGTVTSAFADSGKFLRADGTWQPAGGGASSMTQAVGYISGCWPQYVDTNTVVITNGDGYCNGHYFAITNTAGISVDVSTWPSADWGYVYFYVDDSASVWPTPTVIASTNIPAFSAGKSGWYSGDDRLLGAAIKTNATSALLPFYTRPDGMCVFNYRQVSAWDPSFIGTGFLTVSNGNPNGAWQTISTYASFMPVSTKSTQIGWIQYGPGSLTMADSLDTTTISSLSAAAYYVAPCGTFFGGAAGLFGSTSTLDLSSDRTVIWFGPDANQNYVNIWAQGYLCGR